jgi:hypothetical protein
LAAEVDEEIVPAEEIGAEDWASHVSYHEREGELVVADGDSRKANGGGS